MTTPIYGAGVSSYRPATKRQRAEIERLSAQGLGAREITAALGISHAMTLSVLAWIRNRRLSARIGAGCGAGRVRVYTPEQIAALERPDAPVVRCERHVPRREIGGGSLTYCARCREILPARHVEEQPPAGARAGSNTGSVRPARRRRHTRRAAQRRGRRGT